MREILFRGKTEKGKWVKGVPFFEEERSYIIEDLFICDEYACTGAVNSMVIPETVGQYTGLTDKNGKKVFEGDIVRCGEWNGSRKYLVEMDEDRRGWYPFACGDGCGCCESETYSPKNSEIIGNIHDNPDLLKGE
jgi:hypothetical protein